MPQESHKTQAVADVLGIHPNSVRLWCEALAPFLSSGANPPGGQYRKFTNADLGLLRLASQLRADGQSWPDIVATLESMPPADRAHAVEPPSAPQSATDGPSALVPASAVVQALDVRLAALQRLLDAPPAAQALQNARAQGFAAGVVVAVGIMLALSLLIGVLASAGLGWVARLLGGG